MVSADNHNADASLDSQNTARGIYGIDRFKMSNGETKIRVRRDFAAPGKFKAENFILGSLLALVMSGIGFLLMSWVGFIIFGGGAFFLYWQRVENYRYQDFIFDNDKITYKSGKKTSSFNRSDIAVESEEYVPTVSVKGNGTLSAIALNAKSKQAEINAQESGNSVYIWNGAKRVKIINGISRRQAHVLVQIVQDWKENPENVDLLEI